MSETETTTTLRDVLPSDDSDLILAFGPEGGWTSASLGPTILRAETAAIAALAIVISALQ